MNANRAATVACHCVSSGLTCIRLWFSVGLSTFKVKQLEDLNKLVTEGYNAAEVPLDHRIKWLDIKHFCPDASAPHQHYPELMSSAIKARQTRYLVPVALYM